MRVRERLYFFYDAKGNLVFFIPWHDPEPPYIVEAKVKGAVDDEFEGPGEKDTVH